VLKTRVTKQIALLLIGSFASRMEVLRSCLIDKHSFWKSRQQPLG